MSPPRRASVLLAGALAALSLGFEFEGCGGGDRMSERPLPPSTGGCVFDHDCGADACFFLACVAGECVQTGPRTDQDRDGHAPPPCGSDCDDLDPTIHPGAPERCDSIDQDCDGVVDEGAFGVRTLELDDGLSDAQLVAAGDAFAVIGLGAGGELAGYLLDADGARSAPTSLLAPDAAITRFDATSDGGSIAVAFVASSGPAQLLELERAGDTLRAAGPAEDLGTDEVVAVAAHRFGGRTWTALETSAGARKLVGPGGVGLSLDPSPIGPFLADDGAHLVATSGDAALVFIDEEGSMRALRELPGPLASGLPIASGAGEIVAAYRDALDHSLVTMSEAAMSSASAAPFGEASDALSLHALPDGLLVLRVGEAELRGWLLAPDLGAYHASFSADELSPRGAPSRVSAAASAPGSAILSAYASGSVASFLRCDTAP